MVLRWCVAVTSGLGSGFWVWFYCWLGGLVLFADVMLLYGVFLCLVWVCGFCDVVIQICYAWLGFECFPWGFCDLFVCASILFCRWI